MPDVSTVGLCYVTQLKTRVNISISETSQFLIIFSTHNPDKISHQVTILTNLTIQCGHNQTLVTLAWNVLVIFNNKLSWVFPVSAGQLPKQEVVFIFLQLWTTMALYPMNSRSTCIYAPVTTRKCKTYASCISAITDIPKNFVAIDKKMPEISAIKNLCCPKKWTKVHQNFLGMLLHKTPNQPTFRHNWLKNDWHIRDQKFVLPEKVSVRPLIWTAGQRRWQKLVHMVASMPRQCLKVIVSQTKSVKWDKSPGKTSGWTDKQTDKQTDIHDFTQNAP